MSLWVATASSMAHELATLFTRVGFPKQNSHRSRHSVYGENPKSPGAVDGTASVTHHCIPQTNGLVERFNGTLKRMLRMFVHEGNRDWHKWLPFLLFAIWEVPRASLGLSPSELLYEHHPNERSGKKEQLSALYPLWLTLQPSGSNYDKWLPWPNGRYRILNSPRKGAIMPRYGPESLGRDRRSFYYSPPHQISC